MKLIWDPPNKFQNFKEKQNLGKTFWVSSRPFYTLERKVLLPRIIVLERETNVSIRDAFSPVRHVSKTFLREIQIIFLTFCRQNRPRFILCLCVGETVESSSYSRYHHLYIAAIITSLRLSLPAHELLYNGSSIHDKAADTYIKSQ